LTSTQKEGTFIPSEWIGRGFIFDGVPGFVKDAAKVFFQVLLAVQKSLLPSPDISITCLLEYVLPICPTPCTGPHRLPPIVSAYLRTAAPTVTNINQIISILHHSPIPTASDICSIRKSSHKAWLTGVQSIRIPKKESANSAHVVDALPLWVVTYWDKVLEAQLSFRGWNLARVWVKNTRAEEIEDKRVKDDVLWLFKQLLWQGGLSGFNAPEPIESLRTYLSTDWFLATHQDQMMELLNLEADQHPSLEFNTIFTGVVFFDSIIQGYENWGKEVYLESKGLSATRAIGKELESGIRSMVAGIVHINGNHWVAVVIEFKKRIVYFGDPDSAHIPLNIKNALIWWLSHHSKDTFTFAPLAYTPQQDSYSCRLLSTNAILHHFLPTEFPLIPGKKNHISRMKIFIEVAKQHLSTVSLPIWLNSLL
jgi:hypothetical protein